MEKEPRPAESNPSVPRPPRKEENDSGNSGMDIVDGIISLEAADMAVQSACCLMEAASSGSDGCCLAEAASAFDGFGCFVATAALTPRDPHDHPDLNALRAFRDRVLRKSAAGRTFARLYYRWGRYPAAFIRNKPILRFMVRTALIVPAAAMARRALRVK